MPTDYSLELRKQVVAHLIATPALTALVSASRIYGEQPPADPVWPFIRYGLAVSGPYEATGPLSGSAHRVTIHAFAHGPYTDAVLNIAKQIVAAMYTFQPVQSLIDMQWVGTQVFRDTDEADGYHAAVEFDVVVSN
jgi:hypothetical protein